MANRVKISFKEGGQDLTHVVVETFEGDDTMGEIVAVSPGASPVVARLYVGKAVDLEDNQPGEAFNFADPAKGFAVKTTPWIVESVERGQTNG